MFGPSYEKAEIVLNLWAYADEQGYVRRLAGKCYALHGSDAEKLVILRALSKSDFISAVWEDVPINYGVINADGSETLGVATTNEVIDLHASGHLFGELLNRLERELPEQLVCINDTYKRIVLMIPQDPLVIRTIVIERSDGQLVPLINSEDELSHATEC